MSETTATTLSPGTSTSSDSTTTTPPIFDLGDGKPAGCKGKIDFLFVISRNTLMNPFQAQLAAAVPDFLAIIQAKFDDFDYHIMVVDRGDDWGADWCNEHCTKDGCAEYPPYPCDLLGSVTFCDKLMGAGTVFPAGYMASNKPCPIDGDRRYLTRNQTVSFCDELLGAGTVFPAGYMAANKPCAIDGGKRFLTRQQTDLAGTFACIAAVGTSGRGWIGEALTAALSHQLTGPGGCNDGFLRKDALLMVTLLSDDWDEEGKPLGSAGTPDEWAQGLLAAKGGDPTPWSCSVFWTPPARPRTAPASSWRSSHTLWSVKIGASTTVLSSTSQVISSRTPARVSHRPADSPRDICDGGIFARTDTSSVDRRLPLKFSAG